MEEIVFFWVYGVSSYYDARYGEVPDWIWITALPFITPYIRFSAGLIFALFGDMILYHLDILGGADAKAIGLSMLCLANPITYLLRIFGLLCVAAQAYLLYGYIKKVRVRMTFPFIPFAGIIFAFTVW